METEESALCALHNRVHHLGNLDIHSFPISSCLRFVCASVFLFIFTPSLMLCQGWSLEPWSARPRRIAERGPERGNLRVLFASFIIHTFRSSPQKNMNDLWRFSVHFPPFSHECVNIAEVKLSDAQPGRLRVVEICVRTEGTSSSGR